MNILFMTQSSSLDMFYQLMLSMKKSISVDKVGFYVTDSSFYSRFKNNYPQVNSYYLLKEWEIIRDSVNLKPDISFLSRYEKKIGRPYLWNALVADRRIFFGRKYAYSQDYAPRFNHERMLAILQVALQRVEKLFDELRPDLVVSFQCVTIGEYLSYLFAIARNIKVLNLRPVRIHNYFYAGESVMEPSDNLREEFENFCRHGVEEPLRNKAVNYMNEIRNKNAMYEGVVPPSNTTPATVRSTKKRLDMSRLNGLKNLVIGELRYRFGEFRFDNHVSGFIEPFVYNRVVRVWRAKSMERKFKDIYVSPKELPRLNYAFFPLHVEPEITLMVYSKPYLNQIEAVRLFSHNLPVGMKLIVKEHPVAIGKRPIGYYKKLLEIPNVMLAHPATNSRDLVTNAKLITLIAGSVGFEGLILKKPVVVLGNTPYNFLPTSMMRHVRNTDTLGDEVRDLMENYKNDEDALISYIAAVIDNSVSVDFYSRLLGRKEAYIPDKCETEEEDVVRKEHIDRLADYLIKRFYECRPNDVKVCASL